jgi:hypothetical protein
MEWLLPCVLGFIALAYVCSPLWMGASSSRISARGEGWHSLEQLEIDRALGKIDDAEFEDMKSRIPAPTKPPQSSLEALIFGVRRQKRLNTAAETEVLIARARRASKNP